MRNLILKNIKMKQIFVFFQKSKTIKLFYSQNSCHDVFIEKKKLIKMVFIFNIIMNKLRIFYDLELERLEFSI
jgi:hypothetical protein